MDNIAEDIYTIVSKESKKAIQLDLTTPFILNSISAIINVPYEDIFIKNSLGDLIEEIKKEDLLIINEFNSVGEEVAYYFLNLVDILFDPIVVKGYVYSKLYPLKELEENEYGLQKGKIVTGKGVIVDILGIELIKKEVEVVKVVNYTNGNYIKRLDTDFTYYSEQYIGNKEELTNIIKLNNVSIEKGSIKIEEYYEDGENYTSTPSNTFKYINVNTKDDPAYLKTDTDTYLQE